mgnify:CR=1 FL=1
MLTSEKPALYPTLHFPVDNETNPLKGGSEPDKNLESTLESTTLLGASPAQSTTTTDCSGCG